MSERSAASLSALNDLRAFVDADEQRIIRASGDIIAMAPPFIINTERLDQLVGMVGDGLGGLN